jgi:hypothetical protein
MVIGHQNGQYLQYGLFFPSGSAVNLRMGNLSMAGKNTGTFVCYVLSQAVVWREKQETNQRKKATSDKAKALPPRH